MLLADVAVLRLDRFAELGVARDLDLLERRGREDVRRREHRLARAARGSRSRRAPPRRARASPPSPRAARLVRSRRRWTTSGLKTSPAAASSRVRSSTAAPEQAAVADDRLERLGGDLQPLGDPVVVLRHWRYTLVLTDGHRRRVATSALRYAGWGRPAGRPAALARAFRCSQRSLVGCEPFSR